uniref:beta strand repeat-containing protein n=1 Tax=Chryseobacterium binzhouense TaxID=2593646 RepID=UPI001E659881
MKLKLHTKSKMLYAFLMALFSVWSWGQTTLVNYKFEDNLLPESGSIGSPNLTASSAVSYFAGVTGNAVAFGSSTNKYFELTISTIGYTNVKISFSGRSSQSGSIWSVTGDPAGGSTFSNITSLNSGNGSFTNLAQTTLGSNYDNKTSIRIRITSTGTSATHRLDDLILVGTSNCVAPSNPGGSISGITPACNSTVLTYNPSVGENAANLYWQTSLAGTSLSFPANNALDVTSSGTYYVRAYNGTCWSGASTVGYPVTINSTSNAVITTNSATAISYNTVTLNGNLATLGTCPATVERGFVYGTFSGSYGAPIVIGTTVTTGSFNINLSSLTAGTTYFYRAYVKDANGIYIYGTEQTFTTLIPATQIVFVNVPSSGFVNSNLGTFSVQARTPNNTIDTNYSGFVTINKLAGTGTMSGTTSSVNFINGVATFNDIKFDIADNYTISAVSGNFPTIVSGIITINNAPVAIVGWDFENTTITGTGNTPNVNPVSANFGLLTTGSVFSGYHSSSSSWSTGTGNGSSKAATVPNWNNGDYWQIKFATTGYKNIRLKISQRGSNTGPRDFKLQYSTDGISFTDLAGGNYSIVNDSWNNSSTVAGSVRIFDFDTVSLINNKSQVFIRILNSSDISINNGSVASGGTSFIDDITVEGLSFSTTIWSSSWSNGIPNNETNVIINGIYTTTSNPAFTANNITIKNGGVLEINGTNTVNAADVTVEDGGNLVIKDSGVLNHTGTFKVLKNGTSVQDKYAFWSSPVASQNLTAMYPGATPSFITEYNTATDYFVNAASTTSAFAKGY